MFWKRKRKVKNLSLTGRNKNEFISIVVSKRKKLISIVKQDSNQISHDTYRIEDIKRGFACMESKCKKQDEDYLAEDIKEIIIETDEKDPKIIARINEILCPSEGYRVRVKFSEN